MDTQPHSNCCPKCQTPLPADAPQGLCPKCLLAAVATPTDAGQPAGRPAPPAIGEIAAAFPQLEIIEFIGQGGMGFVFKARQPKLDRLVALKILPQSLAADPTFAERFNREARLLARLNHPGIVTVHDFGVVGQTPHLPGEASESPENSTISTQTEPNQTGKMPVPLFYYLLMEFVDGVNLRQAMQAGRFTPEQALAIVPKICEALQFAHNEGILHRDIKPENILLDAKGRVKIADFGIAKLVERGSPSRSTSDTPNAPGFTENSEAGNAAAGQRPALHALTEAGKGLGTPNYMAPEQLENAGDVDHRADIYSLGVVFYEMLTGELPLGRFAPPSQKSAADPRVDEVVLRALEKEKTKRYASADEMNTQVETVASSPESGRRRGDESQTGSASIGERELKRGGIVIVGRRNGKRAVVWRGVSTTFFAIVGCLLITMLVLRLFVPIGVEPFIAAIFLAALVAAGGVMMGLRTPVELLAPLDDSTSDGSRSSPAQSQSGKQIRPRVTLRVVAGAVWVVLVIMAIISFIPERKDTTDDKLLAIRPDKLGRLPTDRLIQVALGNRQSSGAWRELVTRAKAGNIDTRQANTIFNSVTDWLRAEHPQGYDRPLFPMDDALVELSKPWLAAETNTLDFLEAYYGKPSIEPLARLRESAAALFLRCEWRWSWLNHKSLGFELLNEMRSISVDGRQVPAGNINGWRLNQSQSGYSGGIQLPKLAPGKHTVRCEVDSALIATADMAGMASGATSQDWPPARRRWTRVGEAEFTVFAADAEIVRLTNDPSLNPVANGALSATQVIIRSSSGRRTATVSFKVEDRTKIPISVDVTLRLAGQTIPCGRMYDVNTFDGWSHRGAHTDHELTADIGPLDAETKEAEVVLKPNAREVEEYPYVDRIWGGEIVISHVPLSRQDLYGARPAAASATKPATKPATNPGTNWPGRDYYILYAWDVSYNLTTNVASLDSRWQLLLSAISKLRDEGLRAFPDDVPIHRELAWLFQHRMGLRKVGGDASLEGVSGFRRRGQDEADSDQIYFRYQWFKRVEQAQANGQLESQLRLDPAVVRTVDAQYGPLDWRLPESHAIYWCCCRLNAKPPLQEDDLRTLQRIIHQSLQLSYQRGKIVGEPSSTEMLWERNLEVIPKLNTVYGEAIAAEPPATQAHVRNGHRNFLLDAIVALHEAGRQMEAASYYDRLAKLYPDKPVISDDANSLPSRLTCEEFVRRKLSEK